MDGESRRTASPIVEGQFNPERMSALTDGVFAIVLTLLVLELRLPERDESILALLRDDWRVFVAWLISFVLLARFWLVLHAVTAGLRQCHTMTLALNFAGPIARNVIKMWFVGTWYQLPQEWRDVHAAREPDSTHVVSPASYTEGLLWPTIGANPPGAKGQGFGSWVGPPAIDIS